MVLISFTNCVVDEFNYGKDSADKYLYFLTHMHADHYWGITPGRNYKAIYCSNITKKILLNKFPTLKAPVPDTAWTVTIFSKFLQFSPKINFLLQEFNDQQ